MSRLVRFTIDGNECMAEAGKSILQAAKDNGFYIPTLCNLEGVKPRGSCRICNVKVNGRWMTSCTTPVTEGMEIENDSKDIVDFRSQIVEILFVEGNHFCPACEKSGNCELQALAYRFEMTVPRFPFQFPNRQIDASNSKIIKDHNRCILCKRCVRAVKDADGKSLFAFKKRGQKVEINVDAKLAKNLTEDLAQKAMEVCPVGAILVKEKGFNTPIGKRKFDEKPIGSEIEQVQPTNA